MNYKKCSAYARVGALVLAAAITVAAAAALTVSDRSGDERGVWIELNALRSGDATLNGAAPLAPLPVTEEPELSRTDRANEHHG